MNTQIRKSVLVVDDSATMRMYLSMTIKKFMGGLSVSEAVDGAEAVAKMENRDFDLVLTDIVMPQMDGIHLVDTMRRSFNRSTPIVVVTTKGEEKERDAALSLGANAYIAKPVNVQKLREIVLKFLS